MKEYVYDEAIDKVKTWKIFSYRLRVDLAIIRAWSSRSRSVLWRLCLIWLILPGRSVKSW